MERRRGDPWDGALVPVSMSAYGDPYELFHSQGSRNAGHWHDAVADELLDASSHTAKVFQLIVELLDPTETIRICDPNRRFGWPF